MSQENVELLRLFYEADLDSDELLKFLDPEVELYPGIRAPDQRTRYAGREGWSEFIAGALEAWESVTVEPKEIIETGDRILSIDQWVFRGRDGIEIDRELAELFTFQNGLIVRIDGFTDTAQALEAAGLSE
jgi:ketosteroid isomerase-like protein